MTAPDELYLGLMSGTSLDGIDAVLVDLVQSPPRLIAAATFPFSLPLRDELLALCSAGPDEIERLGRADRNLGEAMATAALHLLDEAAIPARSVRAIGSHGQTVRHRPGRDAGFTLQLGDPNTLVERTGITTIADFRRRDVAAGGQGAPLVPAFHAAVFRGALSRAVINIGGIANVTLIGPDDTLLGFDTGPGNGLLDAWIQSQQGRPYDKGGAWASCGTVEAGLLTAMLSEPYFAQRYPKSTGRELFNRTWLDRHIGYDAKSRRPEDIQATLAELTAITIAEAIKALPMAVEEVFVCGGGAYNTHLLGRLQSNLDRAQVKTTAELGISPEWVEAVAFAWLAQRTLHGLPGNAPAVTGATRHCILGAIYPAG